MGNFRTSSNVFKICLFGSFFIGYRLNQTYENILISIVGGIIGFIILLALFSIFLHITGL